MRKDYYIGLDIGTESVGWAVTDTDYNLMRAKGKDLWGVRLFSSAEVSNDRRVKRCARRRLNREKARKNEIRKIFEPEIEKIDPYFFLRLDESKYHIEDRSSQNMQKFTLFSDINFTDKDYFEKYPTIFHLKKELLESKDVHDVRLVFLAIYHYFSCRGHFLSTFLGDEDSNVNGMESLYRELVSAAIDVDIELPDKIDVEVLKDKLTEKGVSRTKTLENLQNFFSYQKSNKREIVLLKLICGLKVNVLGLLPESLREELKKNDKLELGFRERNYEENLMEIREGLPEEYQLVIELAKNIHDFALLTGIIGDFKYLSQARVQLYEKHKEDLKCLKALLKDHDRTVEKDERLYAKFFRKFNDKNNYTAYVGSVNSYGEKTRRETKKIGQDDLYNEIKKLLNKIESEDERKKIILHEMEIGAFLPKQRTSANGMIPNQIHAKEIRKILENASTYLSFLDEKDESDLTVKERMLALFQFQIPYYIGPLGNHMSSKNSKNVWIKRKDFGKIYPWNIEQNVDMPGTAEEFISRMVRKCTYLPEKRSLPKQSLLYEKFMLLNEINNICIDGENISVDTKQKIFEQCVERKKYKKKDVLGYLMSINLATKDSVLTGIDESWSNKMQSHHRFFELFGERIKEDAYKGMIEDIIFWGTIFGEDKKYLKYKIVEKYGTRLDEQTVKRILVYKFKDWGRLSKEFLEISGCCKDTGEIQSIIQAMWNTNNSLMELLSEDFTYSEEIEEINGKNEKLLSEWTYDDLEGMYLSAPVKRMIWQTIKVVRELEEVLNYPPKRIFVEITRSDGEKGKRTDSRKKKLVDIYKRNKIQQEYAELFKILQSKDDSDLRDKKLYLYFMQLGRDMYTGESIDLAELFDNNKYDIDHIYPRSLVSDDSLQHNLVLANAKMNRDKTNKPIQSDIQEKCRGFWKKLFDNKLISEEKYNRLTRKGTTFSMEEKAGFIARQLVETGQATKIVAQILGKSMRQDVKIVFNKPRLISDFRQKFEIYKSRSINDFHHANDAYLNIVVGNSYYVKFNNNPMHFLKNAQNKPDEYKYNMDKLFDYDIKSRSEIAWIASPKHKNHGIDISDDRNLTSTICMVKSMLKKQTPLISRKTEIVSGGFYDETIIKARECKELSHYPLKTKSDSRLEDIKKYGGKTSIRGSGYALVEYSEGKKRRLCLEEIPILLGQNMVDDELDEYLYNAIKSRSNKEISDFRIVFRFIPFYSLVKIDGYFYYIGGRSNDRIYIKNASQLKLENKWHLYIKKLEKAIELNWYREVDKNGNLLITEEQNMELYDILRYKTMDDTSIYSKRKNPLGKDLDEKKSMFIELEVSRQCKVLMKILLNISKTEKADLRDIGGTENSGVCLINKNIVGCSEFKLYLQSVTGLFCKERNLLKL